MKPFLLLSPALLFFTHTFSQVSYTTTCEMRDGKATGYIQNMRDAFTVDGTLLFHFYDCNGNFLDTEDEYEYEYVSAGTTEEIDNTSTYSRACSCVFDVT